MPPTLYVATMRGFPAMLQRTGWVVGWPDTCASLLEATCSRHPSWMGMSSETCMCSKRHMLGCRLAHSSSSSTGMCLTHHHRICPYPYLTSKHILLHLPLLDWCALNLANVFRFRNIWDLCLLPPVSLLWRRAPLLLTLSRESFQRIWERHQDGWQVVDLSRLSCVFYVCVFSSCWVFANISSRTSLINRRQINPGPDSCVLSLYIHSGCHGDAPLSCRFLSLIRGCVG